MPLWLHGALLAGVLLAIVPFTSPDEVWVSDEGAIRLQAEMLVEDGEWTLRRPLAEIDPEGASIPIAAATVVDDRYAPFASHPAVSLVFASAVALVGQAWIVLLSLLAAVVAAVLTALIAAPFGRRVSLLSLWVVGLASPVFAYSFVSLGHTVGTAIAALLVVCALGCLGGRSFCALGVLTAGFAGPLFRTEAVLFGLAVAGVIAISSIAEHWRTRASLAFSLVLMSAFGYWGNTVWERSVVGADSIDFSTVGATGGSWTGVLSGAGNALMSPGLGAVGSGVAVLSLFASVAFLGFAVRSPGGGLLPIVLGSGLVLASGFAVVLTGTEAIWGLYAAFPLAVFGTVSLRSSDLRTQPGVFLGAIALTYAVMVVVTQEPGGGGVQWGGRYFMLSMPALVPLTIAAATRSVDSLDQPARVLTVGALLVATLATGLTAVRTLHDGSVRSAAFARQIEGAALFAGDAGDGHGPLVLSTRTQIGRHGWRHVRSLRYFLVEEDLLDTYASRLIEVGVERAVLFSTSDEEIETVHRQGFSVVSEPLDPWGSGRFLVLSAGH